MPEHDPGPTVDVPRDAALPGVATSSVSWVDDETREVLHLIAEGITELVGFGVAAISIARGDEFEVVAVAGSESAREQLLGSRSKIEILLVELARADDWGMFKFIPHDRLGNDMTTWGWVPDVEPIDAPDAWHPLDMLVAPLHDQDGALRGLVAIDLPTDGLRPSQSQRRLLNKYAAQTGRAILVSLEREVLTEQLETARAARNAVRDASAELTLSTLLDECQPALVRGFRARGMWIQTFGEDGAGNQGAIHSNGGFDVAVPPALVSIAERAAGAAWRAQRVDLVSRRHRVGTEITEAETNLILSFLEGIGIGSILFVPIGSGQECLGNFVLTRGLHDPAWTRASTDVALDVGHDLGRAIVNARAYEREQQLVRELQALDSYKSQLIATVSHELKTPITAIQGNLELLEQTLEEIDPDARQGLDAIDRGARRLVRVVEDLLLLAKVGDPGNPLIPSPVDLRPIVDDVRELTAVAAQRRDLTVVVEAPPDPVVAIGDSGELDRVVNNLVSNAVKYTPEGRTIRVTLHREADEIVLSCIDEGIGISPTDQTRLFDEFFRSTNPQALAQPGTGLGLTIVDRIVARHGGRIEVESELGAGSTFRVRLPASG
ncbi:cell wall metabolism sensor histidine kinase WalK [Nocardioides sp. SYSU D00038]|uniref:sensor histidine kinase n=1 Tax=Nocardioides sp. SYSU D00038 TaxID=2812554 RepID=UPI0019680898|nr:HAMP domain-containing sensor histidine kinase [Nocardioides sp. SYSU D00038]